MAYTVDPSQYDPSAAPGERRPDVRDGRKLLWLIGISYGTSRNGNRKIDTTWVCVHDPDGGQDEGGLVWDTLTLTQAAIWKVQQVSHAAGCRAPFDAEDKGQTWDALSGRPVWADIHTEPKRSGDGMRAVVDRYEPFGDEPSDDMDRIAQEGERWYREWQAKQAQGGGRRRQSSGGGYGGGQQPPPYTDDDIPF